MVEWLKHIGMIQKNIYTFQQQGHYYSNVFFLSLQLFIYFL